MDTEKTSKDEKAESLQVDSVDGVVRAHFFRPAIICGVCEGCGSARYVGGTVKKVKNGLGEEEYRLEGGHWESIDATQCKHYKNVPIQCAYCHERFTGAKTTLGKFAEILGTRIIYVMSFAETPNRVTMYCDSFDCRQAHQKRIRN